MKKLVIILLLMVYGSASFGMTVHFHYCCGKLKKVDFTPPKDKDCGMGKTHVSSKPCCDNQQVELKIKGEQSPAKIYQSSIQYEVAQPVFFHYFVSGPLQNKNLLPEVFAPPPVSTTPLFILHCVFRI